MRVVALSFACNNACIFCAQAKLRATSGDLVDPEAAIERASREISRGETVALVGGEPTLDERLPSFLRKLDEAGAGRIVVQTNGRRLAYRSYTRALRESSSRLSLDVSLAGSTDVMHDYHTGAPGSFKQTVLGLRNARAEGLAASVSFVVTRSSFRHLADVVRLCHALPVTGVRFSMAQPIGTARELRDRVVPAPELVTPYLALALAEASKLGLAASAAPASSLGAPHEGPEGAFAGLGPVEPQAVTDARIAEQSLSRDARRSLQRASSASPPAQRSLPMAGRAAPGLREERTPARKTGDELRSILPSLFDGSAPRAVADVVAAAKNAAQEPPRSHRDLAEAVERTG